MKLITNTELAKKIGLGYVALKTHLSKFEFYRQKTAGRNVYRYSVGFLEELKSYFEHRAEGGKQKKVHKRVAANIERLIEKCKKQED